MTKQITIEEFLEKNKDYMEDGYITCDKDGIWKFYRYKPEIQLCGWFGISSTTLSKAFNIAPAKDWTKSLIKIERK